MAREIRAKVESVCMRVCLCPSGHRKVGPLLCKEGSGMFFVSLTSRQDQWDRECIFIMIMVVRTPPDTYLMVGQTIFNTPLSFVGNNIDIRNLQMYPQHWFIYSAVIIYNKLMYRGKKNTCLFQIFVVQILSWDCSWPFQLFGYSDISDLMKLM